MRSLVAPPRACASNSYRRHRTASLTALRHVVFSSLLRANQIEKNKKMSGLVGGGSQFDAFITDFFILDTPPTFRAENIYQNISCCRCFSFSSLVRFSNLLILFFSFLNNFRIGRLLNELVLVWPSAPHIS